MNEIISKYFSHKEKSNESPELLKDKFLESNEGQKLINCNTNDFIKYDKSIKVEEIEDSAYNYVGIEKDWSNYPNISHFISAFLKFFGKEFDNEKYGIRLNGKKFGIISPVSKDKKAGSISVESIHDQDLDIGQKCTVYPKIKLLFKNTYNIIKSEREKTDGSFLKAL